MTTPVAGTTHEIVLTDYLGYALGLRPCNAAGDIDDQLLNFRREPQSRTSVKTSTGEQKYSDLQPPYGTLAQDSWISGRGLESLAEDKTRFADSMSLWTLNENQAILGPKPQGINYGTSTLEFSSAAGGTADAQQVGYSKGTLTYRTNKAASFVTPAGSATTVTKIQLYLRRVYGTGASNIAVTLRADNAGAPGSTVATATLDMADVADSFGWIEIAISASLTAETKYWICLVADNSVTGRNGVLWYTVYFSADQTYPIVGGTDDGTTWDDGDDIIPPYTKTRAFFKINNGGSVIGQPVVAVFPYRGGVLAVTKPKTGASKLLINGDRGVATGTQNSTHLIDTTKSWTADEWIGCVVKIDDGTGIGQYRTITDNDATSLTVAAWDTTPAAGASGSEYVILGSDKWSEVLIGESPASPFTVPVTSVCLGYNETFYAAQGVNTNIMRLQWYNNAGVATWRKAEQTDRKAELIARMGANIYYSTIVTRNYIIYYSQDNKAWADMLDNHQAGGSGRNTCPQERITAFCYHKGQPSFFTDKRLWMLVNGTNFQASAVEYGSHAADTNGINTTWNGLLYFSLGYGLQRMANEQVDDVGPNRGAGLPAGRQGYIAAMCPVLDGLFCALNGSTGRSSVLVYNNFGWHELVRAQIDAAEITCLFYQSIPGGPNRLWYSEGQTIMFIELPDKTSNPYKDSRMVYASAGELVTPWIDCGLADATKFFHEMTVLADNLLADKRYIDVYYQIDDATDASVWTALSDTFDTSPSQTISLTALDTLVAKRIRFKLVVTSLDETTTPRLKAWSLEYIARMQAKYAYALTVGIPRGEALTLMSGEEEDVDPDTIIAKLDEWAAPDQPPLILTSSVPQMHNKRVFLDPCPLQIRNSSEDAAGATVPSKYVVTLRMMDA